MELTDIKTILETGTQEIKDLVAKHQSEIQQYGEATKATEGKLEDAINEWRKSSEAIKTRMDELEAKSKRLPAGGSDEAKETFGFKSFGEFIHAVRFQKDDKRLEELSKKALSTDQAAAGGVLIPPAFGTFLTEVKPQEALVRPRATVIPAGSPPDAEFTFPALDQGGNNGVFAGVQVNWIAEGAPKPETEPQFRDVTLRPKEVAAHTVVTDKTLRNAPAAGTVVENLLRRAILAAEDTAFLRGNGVGRPLGIIGHPSVVTVARAAAGQITYQDLVNMYARILMGGEYAWIASPTVLPQLMTMATPMGQLVWQPSAREGVPGTLLGIPLLMNQRSPVLGSEGDLGLFDFSHYWIKDGSGIFVEASPHPLFTQNRTIIKAYWNVDGQPGITSPLLLEDGVSTVSPFVVLR